MMFDVRCSQCRKWTPECELRPCEDISQGKKKDIKKELVDIAHRLLDLAEEMEE